MPLTTSLIFGSAILAIAYGVILIKKVLSLPAGNEKMQAIAKAIQEGAKAYLNRQYKTVAMVAMVLFIVIGLVPTLGWTMAIAFLLGAFLSALTGYIGMNVSVRANVRATELDKYKKVSDGFFIPSLIKVTTFAQEAGESSLSITLDLKSIKPATIKPINHPLAKSKTTNGTIYHPTSNIFTP